MKRMFWICLLAVPGKLFAQNLELADLRWLLETDNIESITKQLQSKGYKPTTAVPEFNADNRGVYNSWVFPSANDARDNVVSNLYKSTGSVHSTVSFKTSNAFFFSHLVNQLPDNGFVFLQTVSTENQVQLSFCNGFEEVLLITDNNVHHYELILQPYTGNKRLPVQKTKKTQAVRPTEPTHPKTDTFKMPQSVKDTSIKKRTVSPKRVKQPAPKKRINPVNQ